MIIFLFNLPLVLSDDYFERKTSKVFFDLIFLRSILGDVPNILNIDFFMRYHTLKVVFLFNLPLVLSDNSFECKISKYSSTINLINFS